MGTDDGGMEQEISPYRFQRLITEVLEGDTRRNVFQPWEVEILLDIQGSGLDPRLRRHRLQQYMRAVRRQLENEPGPPMKLSEFLQTRRTRRPSRE